MPDSVIKREASPEASVIAMPPMAPATSQATAASSMPDAEDIKLPIPRPYMLERQDHLAPSAYHGSSPRKYKLSGRSNSGSRVSDCSPLLLACLPSRATSAMATPRVNKASAKTTTRSTTPTLNRIQKPLPQNNEHKTEKLSTMDAHGSGENYFGNDMNFLVLPPVMDTQEQDSITGTNDLAKIRSCLQMLQNAAVVNDQNMSDNRMIMGQLVKLDQNLYNTMQQMSNRVSNIESDTTYMRSILTSQADTTNKTSQSAPAVLRAVRSRRGRGARSASNARRSRSPSLARLEYSDRAGENTPNGSISVKTKAEKDLQVQTSSPPHAAGLPTPLQTAMGLPNGTSAFSSSFLTTPITPGRVGPPNSNRKSTTSLIKRKVHNLEKMAAPTFVRIPFLPLTDTEIIVFFFQSLSRPVVTLRLYARNWGPADITDVLNEHRDITPPYLRNTCSVKCTTALKKGTEQHGEDWDVKYREVFPQMGDDKATDLIHLNDDEAEHGVDYDMRCFAAGLRKFPEVGRDGGIFTRCVKYCADNNAPYTLANVCELACALEKGITPRHPPSPASPPSTVAHKRGGQKKHKGKANTAQFDLSSPTPASRVRFDLSSPTPAARVPQPPQQDRMDGDGGEGMSRSATPNSLFDGDDFETLFGAGETQDFA